MAFDTPDSYFTARLEDYTALRHDIHQHPETAFEEVRTSNLLAEKLESFGLEVHRGLAGTGLVAKLTYGTSDRAIGLRADMDALHMDEMNDFAHASQVPGKMHGCGHDGHSVMLLAAAEYLSKHDVFDGTVYFIFQPAEENEGGGRVMVEEGLFDKFPMEAVFGMHNIPGIPLGHFALKTGPLMAGYDRFEIVLTGKGGHAGIPHMAVNPLPVAGHLAGALQSIVPQTINPLNATVLSLTKINGGHTFNVIPETVTIGGTVRYLNTLDRDKIRQQIRKRVAGIADAHGIEASLDYQEGYPPTINEEVETANCTKILQETFGEEAVWSNPEPLMGSEDFAFMLNEKPGCYIWAGNGETGPHSCMIHNPRYDFNDDLLPIGALYWAKLAEGRLPKSR